MTYNPLHGVRDREKFNGLVESFRAGRPVPAIAVQGETALSGSHRVAAFDAAYRAWAHGEDGWEDSPEPVLETVEVTDTEYLAACELLGVASHNEVEHFDLFAAALYHATGDDDLKAALSDQRGDYEHDTVADFRRYAESR